MTRPTSDLTRRQWLALGLAPALAGLPGLAPAAEPGRPIRLLVGFPAGGGTDAIARILADALKELLNAPVIVENKPGAGGQLAAQALKAAPPDGSTWFLTHDHTISILPQVVKTPGFDPAHDFIPAAGFASFVNCVAVSPGTPAKSLAEFIDAVKAQGGKSAVGVPAPASVPEFLVRELGAKRSIDLVPVPYRGSAPLIADMLGSQIPAGIASVPDFIENHRAGKLRIVATLGAARQPVLPDVPTLAELGIAGFEDLPYYGVFAPAGTPAATVDAFAAAVARAVAQPAVRERLTMMGLAVEAMSPAQLGAREQAYTKTWARIIKSSGFQPL